MRGKANPKSSTGRLDVFTRVITDRGARFDEIRRDTAGACTSRWSPAPSPSGWSPGCPLNQLRLSRGDARIADAEIVALHREEPLLFDDGRPVPAEALALADGLFLRLDLTGDEGVGYKARRNAGLLDLSRTGAYETADFWEPVRAEAGRRVILEPEEFYLLLSWRACASRPAWPPR